MAGNKRERLLEWLRDGDPRDVPVLMGPGFGVASSYLGKDRSQVSWADAIRVAQQTGTHNIAIVAQPMPLDVVGFLDDIELQEIRDTNEQGISRLTRRIKTPEGVLEEVQEFPKASGSYHRQFFVKGKQVWKAYACLIRKTTEAFKKNRCFKEELDRRIKAGKEEIGGAFPTAIHVFIPAVALTCSYFTDQENAIYMVYDAQELMEELMECYWQLTDSCLELAAANQIDIYNYAINGFEWLSPDLYERYMIPQARRINDWAREHGKLSWVHTCGKLRRIAEAGMYQRMKADVVESLSWPPTGDIEDFAQTRAHIGPEITTRGGVNCELFYEKDSKALRECVERVLEATTGFMHAVGDTNDSYPAYPWASTQTVIDIVRDSGRLFD